MPTTAPRLAAILLAAGRSARFGDANKLLANFQGGPMIRRVARQIAAYPFVQRILVTGYESAPICEALRGLGFEIAHNPEFAAGMGGSIAAGAGRLRSGDDGSLDGVMIIPGDMPLLTAAHFAALAERFSGPEAICAAPRGAAVGPPILFGAAYFTELRRLGGQTGGRAIIERHRPHLILAPIAPAALQDIDTRADLQARSDGG